MNEKIEQLIKELQAECDLNGVTLLVHAQDKEGKGGVAVIGEIGALSYGHRNIEENIKETADISDEEFAIAGLKYAMNHAPIDDEMLKSVIDSLVGDGFDV